jgi:prepilin-type N-terminal cleavage/methylation domain-containing protein
MCNVNRNKKGFTLVELLTVLAVITILVGLLVPSMTMIRRTAKEAKQKAMLTAIEAALTTFRNDYGDYPPSEVQYRNPGLRLDGCGGAQKLAEAMFGQDLQGFHPETNWLAGSPAYGLPRPSVANLQQRKNHYLDLSKTDVFRVGDVYARAMTTSFPLAPGSYVICDVFGKEKIGMRDGTLAKAGVPILYYRANPSSRIYDGVAAGVPEEVQNLIYNYTDNHDIVVSQGLLDGTHHPLEQIGVFYGSPPAYPLGYIEDPRVANRWPYRPDSYLLITAGADGIYGTADDICNFGN